MFSVLSKIQREQRHYDMNLNMNKKSLDVVNTRQLPNDTKTKVV